MKNENMTEATETHVFEKAGLGKAPFKYIGFSELSERRVTDAQGFTHHIAAGGSCDYCGAAIHYAMWIQDANGKRFKVGCDCVEKTGAKGIKKHVAAAKKQQAKAAREKAKAKEVVRIAAAQENYKMHRNIFVSELHPKRLIDRATCRPLSLYDYFNWIFANAGHTGKLKATRQIEKMIAAHAESN